MSKIVIETNNYFTEERWKNKFSSFPQFNNFKVVFFNSEKKFREEILDAEICFLLSFRKDYDYYNKKLKALYLGISDIDFLDNYKDLDKLNLFFAKGFSSNLIAEYALTTSLCLIRNMDQVFLNKKKRLWDQEPFLSTKKPLLRDHKVGVMGLGNIGMAIVKIFSKLGCRVEGLSVTRKKEAFLSKWYSREDLDEFLENNEIIIIALPLRTETNNLLRLKHFKHMGPASYLINVSRSSIINEEDLIEALESKIIKAAALDVSSIENQKAVRWWNPLSSNNYQNKLWEIENLIISPHISGNANIFVEQIQNDFINKILELNNFNDS